jgi:GDP-L-fucose synthase
VNLYGPGDNFDPATSHVIPALIRKCLEARDNGNPFIEVWGTGNASREFLYVEDAAEGILLATERYDEPGPVNLGTGAEVTIRDVAHLIAEITGFTGDTSKPDGQPKRGLDTSLAFNSFNFQTRHPLRTGLALTIERYQHDRQSGKSLAGAALA